MTIDNNPLVYSETLVSEIRDNDKYLPKNLFVVNDLYSQQICKIVSAVQYNHVRLAEANKQAIKNNKNPINPAVTTLGISVNDLDPNAAFALGEMLRNSPYLNKFSLQFTARFKDSPRGKLTVEAVHELKGLKDNTVLKVLNLDGNRIGDDTIKELASLLEGNHTLTELRLHNNNIGDEGAKAIARIIKGNSALKTITLHNNKIGDEGAKALIEAMKDNKSLREFSVHGNVDISDKTMLELKETIHNTVARNKLTLPRNNTSSLLERGPHLPSPQGNAPAPQRNR